MHEINSMREEIEKTKCYITNLNIMLSNVLNQSQCGPIQKSKQVNNRIVAKDLIRKV